MSFIRIVSGIFAADVVTAVAMLCVGIVTARLLGPEGRGIYAVFFTTAGLVANGLYLGISQSNVYYLNKEKQPLEILLGNSALFVLIQGCILAVAFYAFHKILVSWLLGASDGYFVAFLWAISVMILAEGVIGGIGLGRHWYGLYTVNRMLQGLAILVATFALFLIPASAPWAISLRVFAMAAGLAWYLTMIWLSARPHYKSVRVSAAVFILQVRFGAKNYAQNMIGLLNYKIYLLLLATLAGPGPAGLFSIALLFVEGVRFIPNTVGQVLLPKLVSLEEQGAAGRVTGRISRNVLALALGIGTILFVVLPTMMELAFGAEYLPSVGSARLMLVGALGGVLYQVMTRYFTSQHLQIYSIVSALVGLVIGVGLSVLLIPDLEVLGAAWSYTASTWSTGLLMLVFFRRTSGLSTREIILIDRDDVLYFRSLLLTGLKRQTGEAGGGREIP